MTNALRKPEDLNKQFLELFTATTGGVHVISQKKDGRMHQYFTKDLASQQYPDRENIFMTLNTTKKWNRRKANICTLNAFVIDLDYYKFGKTKAQVLYQLPVLLKDENIFQPTAIIDSGHGLYLIWKIEERNVNNQVMARLYEKITKALQVKLAPLGADPQACDVLHLFRMPGTVNTKGGKRKEVYVEQLDETKMYDLECFAAEVLEELPERRQKSVQTPKDGQKPASIKRLFNPFTLAVARAKDLERLAQLRDFEMDGHRHTFLNIYATYLTQAGFEDYEMKLSDMNALLTRPIGETEVKAIIKNLRQKAEAGLKAIKPDDKAVEKVKKCSYAYKTVKIIEELAITEDEQKSMRTLFHGDERRKRDRLRKQKVRIVEKEEKKTAKEHRDARILALKSEGFKLQQIEETLKAEGEKASLATIKRVIQQNKKLSE